MFNSTYFDAGDSAQIHNILRSGRRGVIPQRFDEYYRCYPMVMCPGAEREHLNYGGKILMPTSALDKLTRLHITYPMLFELYNGQQQRTTHAGVLEFVAEEGKVYLPNWMMQTLLLEAGDFVQIKSTDLPSASLVKLQPQSINFLDISDPKAVLENAFRNFSTVTKGDVFSFHYNDTVYDVAVLEVKPENTKMGVCMLETDVSVEFAPPIGYVDPERNRNVGLTAPRNTQGGHIHSHGTMAQSINYNAIAPSNNVVADAKTLSSNFRLGGQKLNSKKGSKPSTPKPSTPDPSSSANLTVPQHPIRKTNGPQPLRLPPNKLFFGYEIKMPKTKADEEKENKISKQPKFEGQGQTLRGGVKRKGDMGEKFKRLAKEDSGGRRLDGKKA